jgi:hypothetical protein
VSFLIFSQTDLIMRALPGQAGVMVDDRYNSDPHYYWDLVPFFDSSLGYAGYALRNKADGRYLRACQGMPDGGGVSMVTEAELDNWGGWQVRHFGNASDRRVTISVGTTYYPGPHYDLTLAGASGWKAGTQVINYHWEGGINQLWRLHVENV